MTNQTKGSLYCIISGLLYGLLGYYGMLIINSGVSVYNMLFWRFLVASSFILLILLLRAHKLKLKYSELIGPLIAGGILQGAGSGIYFIGSEYIGTGLGMVIFFTYPAIVILGNWLLYRQNISKTYYMSIIVILIGMLLLIDLHAVSIDIYGITLSLISAVFYAAYIMISKKQITNIPPLVYTLMVCMGSCISCLIITLLDGSFVILNSKELWTEVLSLGIICTALPILFLLEGLKYVSADKASILSVLEPVCVFIVGVVMLGEQVTFVQTIGVIILLTGALVVQFDKIKN